jgi:hypothetical protein
MLIRGEKGAAIVVAMMALVMTAALGAALVLTTSIEAMTAGNFRTGVEARYAANAIAEYALVSLGQVADWDLVLSGSLRSSFVDGSAAGRELVDGTTVSLPRILNLARCGKSTDCSDADMSASTAMRPWGANNPRWQLYAHGYLRDLAGSGTLRTSFYVVVMVGDDGSETDQDPARDGRSPDNPGSGVLVLRAEAFGPRGAHAGLDVTAARRVPPESNRLRILSWRDIR